MSRWYDYYANLSPLFEALRFMEADPLEEVAFGIMKLTKQYNNSDVFEAIIENMNKERPHRRWYDQNEHVALIYYSLENAEPEFIDIVTNYLDDHIPTEVKGMGEEVSKIYRVEQ